MKRILQILTNQNYFISQRGILNPINYTRSFKKTTFTKDAASKLILQKGTITYLHKLPTNPKQTNFGHKLYRHIRLGFSTLASHKDAQQQNANVQFQEKQYSIDGVQIKAQFNNQTVQYTVEGEIKGNVGNGDEGLYVMMYTCGKCDTKQVRSFTKRSYHNGVVLIRCDGCQNVHLIADNLKWFEDQPVNVEQLLERKGQKALKMQDKDQINKILNEFLKKNNQTLTKIENK